MSLTITRCWNLREEPNSSVLLLSIKDRLATLSVRNSLNNPKPFFIAIHTFNLNENKGIINLYSEASEYLNSYYMKQVKEFVEEHFVD